MKKLPAIVAAAIIALALGLSMFSIGANAFFNTNTRPVVDSPAAATAVAATASTATTSDTQLSQLQALVQQYQDREKQYQTQLTDAAARIKTDEAQLAQYQQLVQALQDRGIIRITSDGRVLIGRTN